MDEKFKNKTSLEACFFSDKSKCFTISVNKMTEHVIQTLVTQML